MPRLGYGHGEYHSRSPEAHSFSVNFCSALISACAADAFGFTTLLLLFFLENDFLLLTQKSALGIFKGTSIV